MLGRTPVLPLGIVAALLVLRAGLLFRLEVNSDEPQHLHVIYRWFEGAWPYRDVFDNHTPLFHLLFLPLPALFGQTPDIVQIARLAIFPIGLVAVGLFFMVGRTLHGPATAIWSVAILLALGDWSLKALEFRPDVLWMCFWFGSLWVLICAYQRAGLKLVDFFAVGFLLGAALCTSIKTVFLLPSLAVGWAAAFALSKDFRDLHPVRVILSTAGAALLGLAILPAAFMEWMNSKGALDAMRHCLLEVNHDRVEPARAWIFFLGMPLLLFAAWRMSRYGARQSGLRTAILVATGTYLLLTLGFSPSLKKQTFLPVYPLLILFGWQAGVSFANRTCRAKALPEYCGAAACLFLSGHLLWESEFWQNNSRAQRDLLRDVLQLTKAGETILDLKGETIFRQRPIYSAFVLATRRAFSQQRITEEDPHEIVSHGTMVASASGTGFPRNFRTFLKNNYLPLRGSSLAVAGKEIHPSWRGGRWVATIDLMLPGEYVLLRDRHSPTSREQESMRLHMGRNQIEVGDRNPALLFWRRAFDAGYTPERKRDD